MMQEFIEGAVSGIPNGHHYNAKYERCSFEDMPSCLGRVYASFLQAGTDTGRFSMKQPSLHVSQMGSVEVDE